MNTQHRHDLSAQALHQALDRFPRCQLGPSPTPLVALERLSRQLGRSIWLKRDDGLGPLTGGNKTRKLEYLLAEAKQLGARKVVTVGGAQSNHARLTAATARLHGLEPHLLLMGEPPAAATGNLLLDLLVDAELHYISSGPRAEHACSFGELDAFLRRTADELVGSHYYMPIGGSNWRGSLGYIRAAVELAQQVEEAELGPARLIVAAGSGGTLAGLQVGLTLLGSEIRLLGIDIGQLWTDFPEHVSRIATAACHHLGSAHCFDPADVPLLEGKYVGDGYAVPSAAGQEAIRLLARSEGLLLDPTYTGKAFAAMLDLIATGELGPDEPIIFLHTGGLPGLFAG